MLCPMCNIEVKNISRHFSAIHKIDYIKYLIDNNLIINPTCKMCGKPLNILTGRGRNNILTNPNNLIYCSNECKFSDYEYNKKRAPKIKNQNNEMLTCNICLWKTKDVNNLGGHATRHLIDKHSINDIDYKKYYSLTILDINYWKCKICDWKTTDIINKSGAITNHLKNTHSLTLKDYSDNYERLLFLKNVLPNDFYINCQVCGEKLLFITNSHLKMHNMTQQQYKNLYGECIISNFTKEKLIKCGGIKSNKFISNFENDVNDFISRNINTEQTYRKIGNIELDIYIPDKKIAIECNGLYWHSELQGKDKSYHLNKTEKCESSGIRLIHIFDDEWNNKKEIIKNKLLHILGMNNIKRIYARECAIKELLLNEKDNFLVENHIQGKDKSNIYIGLYKDGELVSVMTFSNKRISLGNKIKNKSEYELIRFASKYNVIGGASKLFNYFIKKYNPKSVISYADRRFTVIGNNVYEKLGFSFVSYTKPNYFYTNDYNKRLHRFNFTKSRIITKFNGNPQLTEWENMQTLGYDRIWDCGHLKYEWINLFDS